MSDISNNSSRVSIGNNNLSITQFQKLYRELDSRGDRIFVRADKTFKCQREDMVQLYKRLVQIIRQFGPIATKGRFLINYRNDSVAEFEDFDKFCQSDPGAHASVSVVRLRLEFALLSDRTNTHDSKVNGYEIEVEIRSTAESISREIDSKGNLLLKLLLFPFTCEAKIGYYDYSIAIACKGVIEDWIKSLEEIKQNPIEVFLSTTKRPLMHVLHLLITCSIAFAVGALFVYSTKIEVLNYVAILVLFGTVLSASRVANSLVGMISKKIEEIQPYSIIMMGAGDKRLEESMTERRKMSTITFFTSIFLALLQSFIITLLVRSFV